MAELTDSELREQLAEAQATIDAIRCGDVDAVVVGGPDGQRVFTLDTVDRPYRVIVEQMQEGAVTLGHDGLILYSNRRFATLIDGGRSQLVGRHLGEFVAEGDQLARLLASGGAAELTLEPIDGAQLPVNLSIVELAGEAEAALRCAVVTDLRQIKARQAEVLAAANRLTFALDAANMGSWDLDLRDDSATRSPRHDEIFGYPDGAAEWGLNSALEHFVDEDRAAVVAAFKAAKTTGEVDFQHRIRRASDGETRWLHVRGQTLVVDGRPIRISGVVADVTERRRLDEQIAQVQKMDAIGQLTGGIAHDFNNLLTIVVGNLDMAGRSLETGDVPRARRAVGNALKGAERATVLTQRLLAFSRKTTLEPKVIDVNRLVVGMAELLGRSLGETVELRTVTGAGLWRVEADPGQLENALVNLAVNARDAMPRGGKLTIETQNTRIDETYTATHTEVAPGQYVAIAVTDTGTGMPSHVIARAFDPFFTTKEVGKGTGLGLSQVYGYVKQTGGHVKIYSEPDEGTTVRIYLPRSAIEEAADADAADQTAERGQPAETVLVVEDDDDVRSYTVESLRELGYRVLEAHDGPSALRLLDRQETPIRLLFTDVVMPGMSGRELKDAALAVQPDLKVLFTTGYARSAIDHGGRLDAGVELLPKPFTFAELAAKIRDVLDKGQRDRILIVDTDAAERALTANVAATLGLRSDEAATVREGLDRLKATGGHYDVAFIAVGAGPSLEAVVAGFRAIRSDLPLIVTAADGVAALAARFAGDTCVAVAARPLSTDAVRAAFGQLQLRCR